MPNLEERSQQVSVTGRIYTGSKAVAVWLGEDSSEEAESETTWAVDIVTGLDEVLSSGSSDVSMHNLRATVDRHRERDPYLSLRRLFDQPWWRSAWTFQEGILAPQAVLRYQSRSTSLAVVSGLVRNLDVVISTIQSVVGDQHDHSWFWKSWEWQRV